MIFTREKEFFKLLFYSYMTSNQDIASDVAGGGGGGGVFRTSQKCWNDIKASENVAYMCQVLRSCCKLKINQSWHARVS